MIEHTQQSRITTNMTKRSTRPWDSRRWAVAAAALAISASSGTVSAFSVNAPLHLKSARPSLTRRHVVTDPDTLLRDTVRRGSVNLEALENVYFGSSDREEFSRIEEDAVETTPVTTSLPKSKKKKVIASKKSPKKTTSGSRSSTMPGFGSIHTAGRKKAFADELKLVESRSGRQLGKHANSPEAKAKRQKQTGEAMYAASASVPDSFVQFSDEIHTVDRITPKEEVELGTKTQEAIRLQSIYDNLRMNLDREPSDEEWCAAAGKINMEAVRQAIEEGMDAKNQLVTSNLRMVQGVVNIYIRNGLGSQYNAADLMSEGIVALIRAAEKFDPDRGFRFSTYAMYWIRAAVKRSQIYQSRVITVPQRLYENHKRLIRMEKELTKSLGRKPTRMELGASVGMSEVQVERCMKAMNQRCFSLDASVTNKLKPNSGDRDKDSMDELIGSRADDADYNKVKRIFMKEDLIETLNRHLDPAQVQLLLLRYGLMDDQSLPNGFDGPLTIAQVSQLVGLKPDKVRRMINNSLKQLQFLIDDEWRDFERQLE